MEYPNHARKKWQGISGAQYFTGLWILLEPGLCLTVFTVKIKTKTALTASYVFFLASGAYIRRS